jgi:hypothetical protein
VWCGFEVPAQGAKKANLLKITCCWLSERAGKRLREFYSTIPPPKISLFQFFAKF